MKKNTKSGVLRALASQLKECPAQDQVALQRLFLETWNSIRKLDLDTGAQLSPAILTAVVLSDPRLPLLNEAERTQLVALSNVALERYRTQTNPPNKLGKTIAASLKETP